MMMIMRMLLTMKYVVFISIAFSLTCTYVVVVAAADSLSCIDDNGHPVDYFVIYKFPKIEDSQRKWLRTGVAYAYIDANSGANGWTLSEKSIEDEHSAIGATVTPLFNKNAPYEKIVYNDQSPRNDDSSKFAHAKGLAAFDKTSGFWIRHSVPKFIDLTAPRYDYPNNGWVNGQLMICVTISRKDAKTIDNIGKHLYQMRPNIFDSELSEEFKKEFPIFNALVNSKYNKKGDSVFIGPITSAKGVKFVSFSKGKKFGNDLYANLIAPYFKNSLLAQSWRNGPGGKLDSDCVDTYQVMNIKELFFKKISFPTKWDVTEDHSKWAISTNVTSGLFCASDINRMHSQFNRGGGSLCIVSKGLWTAFNQVVEDLETCPKKAKSERKEYDYYDYEREKYILVDDN